jgi:hypothetical protein
MPPMSLRHGGGRRYTRVPIGGRVCEHRRHVRVVRNHPERQAELGRRAQSGLVREARLSSQVSHSAKILGWNTYLCLQAVGLGCTDGRAMCRRLPSQHAEPQRVLVVIALSAPWRC